MIDIKNKKVIITIVVVGVLLIGGLAFLAITMYHQSQNYKEMQELAELDKQEMENEYQKFADQYNEMKTQINNDSIIEQLTQEQMKTEKLLEELKNVKASDAREIARLKKELETCRAVIRSYIFEIDSLNRLNQSLTEENTRIKDQYSEAEKRIENLNADKQTLSEKVAIAAQLEATGITMTRKNKRGGVAKRLNDWKTTQVDFTLAKNVTASNGEKTLYVVIKNTTGRTLSNGGTFTYANKELQYSIKKTIEYTGEATPITVYWNENTTYQKGTYSVSVFADGNMIGERSFSFDK
ncbi:MAG: hypothetical protein LUC88_03950 [Prevotella sp.]|nr:hypothetical protein [Prevotella sp.]